VEWAGAIIAWQRWGKHVSTTRNKYATIQEWLEGMFLCGPCWGYIRRTSSNLAVSQSKEQSCTTPSVVRQ
jgi:hypothetical protein